MPYFPPSTGGASDHGALTGLADDDHTAYSTNAEFDDHSARHEDGGADEISIAALSGTPVAVTDHLNDATDAHDASAISIVDAGTLITATDVEGALQEIAGASASAHIADATDAHDASAISVLDTAAVFTATEVESALKELYDAITGGGIPGTIFNAKGDLIGASAADTPSLLTVGANGTFLKAASGETTGLIWQAFTRIEYTLGADVALTTANTFYDGPSGTPAAGTYDILGIIENEASGGASEDTFVGRIVSGATVIDEREGAYIGPNSATVGAVNVLSARAVMDGVTAIKITCSSLRGSALMKRNPSRGSSSLNRATILTLVRVA